MKTAAIYARVSSDKQREENTIASQTAALVAFAREQQFEVPQECAAIAVVFEDPNNVFDAAHAGREARITPGRPLARQPSRLRI